MPLTKPPYSMLDPDVAAAIAAANVKLSGDLIQTVSTQTGALATGTTQLPFDDTIPQITEGNEYMTASITPTDVASILEIDVVCTLASSFAGVTALSAALFRDSTANALAASAQISPAQFSPMTISFKHRVVAGSTSATTFRVRGGTSAAGTTTFNGNSGARMFGGVMASSITIKELKP